MCCLHCDSCGKKHLNSSSIKIENKIECDTLSHSCLLLPRNWRGVILTALRTALVLTDSERVNTRLHHRCLTSFTFSVSSRLYRHSRAFTLHEACRVWENKVRGQIFVFSLLLLHNVGIDTDGSQQSCEAMLSRCETNSLRLHSQPGCKYFQGHFWTI